MDVNEKVPIFYKGGSLIWPPLIGDLRSKINFFVSPARRLPRSAPSLFRHAGKLSPNCEGGRELFFFSFFLHLHPLSCLHCMSPSSRSSAAGSA